MIVWPGCAGSGIGPGSFIHVTIIVGAYPVGLGGLTSHVENCMPLNSPHWSLYVRAISTPIWSLKDTGTLGTANFSPYCGEKGSNSEEKSSRTMPVKWAATCGELKPESLARAEGWFASMTSLRSQRLRVAPAKGATSFDSGNRLM